MSKPSVLEFVKSGAPTAMSSRLQQFHKYFCVLTPLCNNDVKRGQMLDAEAEAKMSSAGLHDDKTPFNSTVLQ